MNNLTSVLDLIWRVIEIGALLGGGLALVVKFGRVQERVEANLTMLSAELIEVKVETKKINEVLTLLALQKRQIEMLETRYEELRHGEGFVFPIASALHKKID